MSDRFEEQMDAMQEEYKRQLLTLLYRLEQLEAAHNIPREVRLPSIETDEERNTVKIDIAQRLSTIESHYEDDL